MIGNSKVWNYFSSAPKTDTPDTLTKDEVEEVGDTKFDKTYDLAKTWANYLVENVKQVTNQANTTATKLKNNVTDIKFVEEGNIITKFSDEQSKFTEERRQFEIKRKNLCKPWLDILNDSSQLSNILKQKIFDVSKDDSNFRRDPPAGSDFNFDYDALGPVMMLLLKQDPKLAQKRFELVPQKLKEIVFWRNYFYRINLIRQSLVKTEATQDTESLKNQYKYTDNVEDDSPSMEFVSDSVENNSNNDSSSPNIKITKASTSISDNATKSNVTDDLDLEAELQKELNEFDLVNDLENSLDSDPTLFYNNSSNLSDEKTKEGITSDYDDLEREIMDELEK